MEWTKDDFLITTDKSKIDVSYVHYFLSDSYWAKNIPVETVQKSIENSLCFSVVYLNHQIGFARVITDEATFAYLTDFFIDENFRGRGLSKWLIEVVLHHPGLQGLKRFLFITEDAHGWYEQFGFEPLKNADHWMQILRPEIYKKN